MFNKNILIMASVDQLRIKSFYFLFKTFFLFSFFEKLSRSLFKSSHYIIFVFLNFSFLLLKLH